MARVSGEPKVRHRCPPMCHFCPEIAAASDDETAFMPWCGGGVMWGFEACHCAAAEFDLARLVARRDYLRRAVQDIEQRIRVGEAAAHKALVALPTRTGAFRQQEAGQMDVMMACGHAAQGKDSNGDPVCIICAGIRPGAKQVVEGPDLSGRTARCSYYGSTPNGRNREGPCNRAAVAPCRCEVPSAVKLAFFSHQPDKPHDSFFCGCWGWD